GVVDARSVEHHRQRTPLRIAAHRGPVARFPLGDRGHEAPCDARQVCTEFGSIRVDTTYQVVFLVGHDPWAGRRPAIPSGGIAIVGRLHSAVAVVAAVNLGVAVVEAAAGVIVMAANNPILPLPLVVDSGPLPPLL